MEYEWDPNKETANVTKPNISFNRAILVFLDPHMFAEEVTRPEFGERRFKAVGMIESRLITVIFTDRDAKRRIISARRARTNERIKYDQSKTTG